MWGGRGEEGKKKGKGFNLLQGVNFLLKKEVIFFRLCCIKTINLYRLLLYHQFVFVGVKILSKSLDWLIKKKPLYARHNYPSVLVTSFARGRAFQ